MSAPTVSVVVPTRNRAGYLGVALASLSAKRAAAPFGGPIRARRTDLRR